MARLSDKYIAGFLDADGSINLVFREFHPTAQLQLSFSQKTEHDAVLYMIQEVAGGVMRHIILKNVSYSELRIWSIAAIMLLSRIRKFLVMKRHYADVVLDMTKKKTRDIETAKKFMKEQRLIKSLPLPNFPSRRWLAGYADGDGCFTIHHLSGKGSAVPVFSMNAAQHYSGGIELIQKAFGGSIYWLGDTIVKYLLYLPPSKAIEFIGFFINHLIIKKKQAQFILECARMGHYRDGKHIKEHLKHLKAHEQRLNDSEIGNDLSDSPNPV